MLRAGTLGSVIPSRMTGGSGQLWVGVDPGSVPSHSPHQHLLLCVSRAVLQPDPPARGREWQTSKTQVLAVTEATNCGI